MLSDLLIPQASTEDCLRRYSIDAKCERTGHVWLREPPSYLDGPYPLFAHAYDDEHNYASGKWGRLERRAAFCLDWMGNRSIPALTEINFSALGESQAAALNRSLQWPVSVITGGPGTGKTTIARCLAGAHRRVLGLSPTGKGADRLGESLGVQCWTVQRAVWLYYRCRAIDYQGDDHIDFADYDLIALDEVGMLDTEGLEMFCRAMYQSRTNARIVFLGDPGQLDSVGPGKVLDQLISCLPCSHLDVCYRFNDYEIGQACIAAREGRLHDAHSTAYSLTQGDEETAWDAYFGCIRDFGLYDARVITYHRNDASVINLLGRHRIKENPPVTCKKNSYRFGIFNGQCGYHDKRNNELVFGDKRIDPSCIVWTYCHAATCHGSQGGQWGGVVVWIRSARYVTREWMLTACSRPTQRLIVVCNDASIVERCLHAAKPAQRRISLLAGFLQGVATWKG